MGVGQWANTHSTPALVPSFQLQTVLYYYTFSLLAQSKQNDDQKDDIDVQLFVFILKTKKFIRKSENLI